MKLSVWVARAHLTVAPDGGFPTSRAPRSDPLRARLPMTPEERERRMFAHKVVELREKMIGGKMSGEKLEKVLNDHAREGWQLKAITTAEVRGRVGPGGVEGLLVTFERPA